MSTNSTVDRALAQLNQNFIEVEDISDNPVKRRRAKRLDYVRMPGQVCLSYSRLQKLHECPRKYLLNETDSAPARNDQSIHLAFGSAYGAGIAELWRSNSIDLAKVVALSQWDYDEWDDIYGKVKGKSFWECCRYLENFHEFVLPKLRDEGWQLATINNKPGIELTFFIQLTQRYNYQGHIDILLENINDGRLCVCECKTSKYQHYEFQWGNSEQTAGYYTVLKSVAEYLGRPVANEVIYHTLQVGQYDNMEKDFGVQLFPYQKDLGTELEFIANVLSDINTMEMYNNMEYWPKRGNACGNFGRQCEHYGICDLSKIKKFNQDDAAATNEQFSTLKLEAVDFIVDLTDIIENTEI